MEVQGVCVHSKTLVEYGKILQVGKTKYNNCVYTNLSTSSLAAAITAVVPTLCIKRSFPTQSSASLTNLSNEMLAYPVSENACDAHMHCGTTTNSGHRISLYHSLKPVRTFGQISVIASIQNPTCEGFSLFHCIVNMKMHWNCGYSLQCGISISRRQHFICKIL